MVKIDEVIEGAGAAGGKAGGGGGDVDALLPYGLLNGMSCQDAEIVVMTN